MGALLAIAMFAVFILIDYLLSRRAERREVEALEEAALADPGGGELYPDPGPALQPAFVAGFDMPEPLHYHRGHVWARVLGPDTAVVGIDDFARRLLGRAEGVELPSVGSLLRQGATGARVDVAERYAEVVSPVDGEVLAVNAELAREPSLVSDDPYGRGWLYRIRSTNLAANLRNLLNGSLAKRWMEDSREQLDRRLMALSGSVLADGGDPAHDYGEHVELAEWQALVERFLLTQGCERDADQPL